MDITTTTGAVIVPWPARMELAYRGPCRILGAHITRVARAGAERIICAEYREADGGCQLRKAALEYATTAILTDAPSEVHTAGRTRCLMLTA
jgi:hypothetical protein